jgi:hypothetical protein
MSAENFASHYFRGQGPLYISDRNSDGSPVGFRFVGDVGEVSLQPNVSRGQVIENVTGGRAIGASWLDQVSYNLTINMRSIKPEHMALALHGSATSISASSVTNQVQVAKLGLMIALVHTKLSSVVVTDTAGTTTYVAGTDYVLYADEGLIEILSGGAITDLQTLHVDYNYAAQATVNADPNNNARFVMFSGMNTANNNKRTRCEIYKTKLDPAAYSLISNEAAEGPISGVVELDMLRSSGDRLFKWKLES